MSRGQKKVISFGKEDLFASTFDSSKVSFGVLKIVSFLGTKISHVKHKTHHVT